MAPSPGAMSTITQWKKSTRGKSAGTSRSALLTSSPRLGTSKSWQISTSDFVLAGSSLQARCGLTLSENPTPPAGSILPAAKHCGIVSPLLQLSLHNFIARVAPSNAPYDRLACGMRALHHLDHRPHALLQADTALAAVIVSRWLGSLRRGVLQ